MDSTCSCVQCTTYVTLLTEPAEDVLHVENSTLVSTMWYVLHCV